MTATKRKPKKQPLIDITTKYANNEAACYDFFLTVKYPTGYYCEKCGCTHGYKLIKSHAIRCKECKHDQYLFAGTIFQDNKLPLYKLILGLFLFFSANKGLSAIELASQLDVNYKTALLLARKCRVLMAQSNSQKTLESLFYEADTAYIGAKSEGNEHKGSGTDKQCFLAVLSTGEENKYPHYIKLTVIPEDTGDMMELRMRKFIKIHKECTLTTDGTTKFYVFKDELNLESNKIDYKDPNHPLHWLNIIIGNVKNQILGIYHGVAKRSMQLFLQEHEYRFNHRFIGQSVMAKIKKYLQFSSVMTAKQIRYVMDVSEDFLRD